MKPAVNARGYRGTRLVDCGEAAVAGRDEPGAEERGDVMVQGGRWD